MSDGEAATHIVVLTERAGTKVKPVEWSLVHQAALDETSYHLHNVTVGWQRARRVLTL